MIAWILKEIRNELEGKVSGKYTGNIKFQVNMFEGGISNINVGGERSIKTPKPKKEVGE